MACPFPDTPFEIHPVFPSHPDPHAGAPFTNRPSCKPSLGPRTRKSAQRTKESPCGLLPFPLPEAPPPGFSIALVPPPPPPPSPPETTYRECFHRAPPPYPPKGKLVGDHTLFFKGQKGFRRGSHPPTSAGVSPPHLTPQSFEDRKIPGLGVGPFTKTHLRFFPDSLTHQFRDPDPGLNVEPSGPVKRVFYWWEGLPPRGPPPCRGGADPGHKNGPENPPERSLSYFETANPPPACPELFPRPGGGAPRHAPSTPAGPRQFRALFQSLAFRPPPSGRRNPLPRGSPIPPEISPCWKVVFDVRRPSPGAPRHRTPPWGGPRLNRAGSLVQKVPAAGSWAEGGQEKVGRARRRSTPPPRRPLFF